MEKDSLEFEMLFKKASEMDVADINDCKPNNISCLKGKIESFVQEKLKELRKEEEIRLEQIKKDVEEYSDKNVPKHKLKNC